MTINASYETVVHGASTVGIHGNDERIILPADRAKIEGPAFEGVLYYICVEPFQGEDILIWLSKEEFDILDPMLMEIEEERYQKSFEYDYTRKTMKEFVTNPEKYGPEQRASAMVSCPACGGSLAGSVYRPRCDSCPWDSEEVDHYESEDDDCHDAYREHPLDHE